MLNFVKLAQNCDVSLIVYILVWGNMTWISIRLKILIKFLKHFYNGNSKYKI